MRHDPCDQVIDWASRSVFVVATRQETIHVNASDAALLSCSARPIQEKPRLFRTQEDKTDVCF